MSATEAAKTKKKMVNVITIIIHCTAIAKAKVNQWRKWEKMKIKFFIKNGKNICHIICR